jgi:hypothetical protein
MFVPSYLSGVDEDLARRVIAAARSFAPRIDLLEPGDRFQEVVSILKAVAKEVPQPGQGRVSSQRIGPASVNYYASWFSEIDISSLRAACGVEEGTPGPVGQFPAPTLLRRIWPEQDI